MDFLFNTELQIEAKGEWHYGNQIFQLEGQRFGISNIKVPRVNQVYWSILWFV